MKKETFKEDQLPMDAEILSFTFTNGTVWKPKKPIKVRLEQKNPLPLCEACGYWLDKNGKCLRPECDNY